MQIDKKTIFNWSRTKSFHGEVLKPNNYDEIKVTTNRLHNIKNNLKLKYNKFIKQFNFDKIKYKSNMVTEALQDVCDLVDTL